MPAITFERFDGGLDVRQLASSADANRLRTLKNPRKYSRHIGVELGLSMMVSAFAGLLTYLFVGGTDVIAVSGLTMLFLSCCAGVLGYEAIRVYTAEFKKTVAGEQREE